MKAFYEVDIIDCLQQVMEINTLYFKEDFNYDSMRIENDVKSNLNKNYLWFSRKSGTELFEEEEVFILESSANLKWKYYENNHAEIKVFSLDNIHIKDGKTIGDLYTLDYLEHIDSVNDSEVSAKEVEIYFSDKYSQTFPYAYYQNNARKIQQDFGSYFYVKYLVPDSVHVLMETVLNERYAKAEKGDFDEYLKILQKERILKNKEQEVIEELFSELDEPEIE